MCGLYYWLVSHWNLLPLSEGGVEGIGVPCHSKMAVSVRLEVSGKGQLLIHLSPLSGKAVVFPEIPSPFPLLFHCLKVSQGHSLLQERLQSECLFFHFLEWRQYKRRRLAMIVALAQRTGWCPA